MSDRGGWIKRLWQRISALNAFVLLTIGLVAGIIFWGGFNTVLEMTNTMEFCLSCHEMRNNPYKEYKDTIHYKNPSGVQVTCADCHVPRPWGHKVVRKIKATRELWYKATGKIDTDGPFNSKGEAIDPQLFYGKDIEFADGEEITIDKLTAELGYAQSDGSNAPPLLSYEDAEIVNEYILR